MATINYYPSSEPTPASSATINYYPARSGAFVDPNSITGCVVWLDANSITGNDGDAVSTWTNLATGAATSPTQATGAKQPLLKTGGNGINGKKIVRFDGSNDALAGATFDPGTTGLTFIFAWRNGASIAPFKTNFSSGGNPATTGTTGCRWGFDSDSDATYGMGWGGPAADVPLGAYTGSAINTAYITSYRKTAAGPWSITGGSAGTPADASFPSTSTFNYCVGAESDAPVVGLWAPIDMAEVIVYNTAISDGNRTTVLAYLSAKWAI